MRPSGLTPPSRKLVVLDVPFVPQSEALCGGAAVSMVLRYWGRRDVLPEDFASLVEPDQGGIPASRLAAAIEARGFVAEVVAAGDLQEQLARGRPVIALLQVAPGRRHYVVVVASAGDGVVVHDPADRPFRVLRLAAFENAWARTGHLAIVVAPTGAATQPAVSDAEATRGADDCGGLVPEAVARAASGDLAGAEGRLEAAVGLCPDAALARRELAGVRFRQQRWAEAASLAAESSRIDPGDPLAWRLLATSRFLAGDEQAALAAWNRVGEPQVDLVAVDGLDRTRPAVVTSRLGIEPRTLLQPAGLRRAARRLAAMPTLDTSRLRYQAAGGGRVEVRAAVVERPLLPSLPALVLQAGVDAAARRETRLGLASPRGEGGWLEAGARWWTKRPAAWISLQQPGALRLPGIVSIEALYDEQRYAVGGQKDLLVERRRRATLSSGEWLGADWHGRLSLGIERANDGATGGLAGLRLERRLADDRLALVGEVTGGLPLSGGRRFAVTEARLAARSTASRTAAWGLHGRLGFTSATAAAPLAYWPGAGTGTGRDLLLRAHPLLADGVVTGEAFGRRLLDAGVELERQLARLGPVGVRLAGFVDLARPWEAPDSLRTGRWLTDVGAGLRVALPVAGSLRLDLATPTDGARFTLSAGWQPAWPR